MAEIVMYGTHAVQVTVSGPGIETHTRWMCGKCTRLWDRHSSHMASWCCATHKTCECGEVHSKHYTICDTCRRKKQDAVWLAKPIIPWNGEWPIGEWESDAYFFSQCDLEEYIEDLDPEDVPSLRLTSCRPNRVRHFEVNEWCCDDLPDDGEVREAKSIDERVNAVLSEVGILSYSMVGDRLDTDQVLKAIGWNRE